jgi:hypothetical protein
MPEIRAITDREVLRSIMHAIRRVETVEEVRRVFS